VNVDVPIVVGVPEIVPEVERESPAGREPPLIDHEYGVTPPDAESVVEYGLHATAGGSEVVVIVGEPLTTPGGANQPR
jgi:hypothetical protein